MVDYVHDKVDGTLFLRLKGNRSFDYFKTFVYIGLREIACLLLTISSYCIPFVQIIDRLAIYSNNIDNVLHPILYDI